MVFGSVLIENIGILMVFNGESWSLNGDYCFCIWEMMVFDVERCWFDDECQCLMEIVGM